MAPTTADRHSSTITKMSHLSGVEAIGSGTACASGDLLDCRRGGEREPRRARPREPSYDGAAEGQDRLGSPAGQRAGPRRDHHSRAADLLDIAGLWTAVERVHHEATREDLPHADRAAALLNPELINTLHWRLDAQSLVRTVGAPRSSVEGPPPPAAQPDL